MEFPHHTLLEGPFTGHFMLQVLVFRVKPETMCSRSVKLEHINEYLEGALSVHVRLCSHHGTASLKDLLRKCSMECRKTRGEVGRSTVVCCLSWLYNHI